MRVAATSCREPEAARQAEVGDAGRRSRRARNRQECRPAGNRCAGCRHETPTTSRPERGWGRSRGWSMSGSGSAWLVVATDLRAAVLVCMPGDSMRIAIRPRIGRKARHLGPVARVVTRIAGQAAVVAVACFSTRMPGFSGPRESCGGGRVFRQAYRGVRAVGAPVRPWPREEARLFACGFGAGRPRKKPGFAQSPAFGDRWPGW